MARAIVVGLGIALAAGSYLQAAWLHGAPLQAPSSQAAPSSRVQSTASSTQTLLDRYCLTCHTDTMVERGTVPISLQGLDLSDVGAHAEIWEGVVQKLRTATMPPAGRRRPDKATYDAFATWLETGLGAAAAANLNPGRVPAVHRLNRFEYGNAIRDVLGLDVDVDELLPADESGYGFDNIADVLALSPVLLERYLISARKIARVAVGDPTLRPVIDTYRLSLFTVQKYRASEELPWGTRGGTAFRHYFPLDGEYVVRVRLRENWSSPAIRGLEQREQLDMRLDGQRLGLLDVGGECVGSTEGKCAGGDTPSLGTSVYERTADEPLFVRFQAKAGEHMVGVAFLNRTVAVEGSAPATSPPRSSSFISSTEGGMAVDHVLVEGPFNPTGSGDTPSRRQIFVCHPTGADDEAACAEEILATLARRLYRRPVTDHDVETLLDLYRIERDRGVNFEAGIQLALEGLLTSPHFLLRVEFDPPGAAPGAPYRVSDLALASRLSFFLWGSIPDEQLLDLAVRGELSNPRILEQQVRRMLDDARAMRMVNNFTGQWLALRNIRAVEPDPRVYPDFDDHVRAAFERETQLFLESQVRDDRSLLELLTANYTFVNEPLARLYGIPNVYGSHFRRVTLNDPNRAGLLGQGSILTLTSYSTRTSPVVRGKYLLDRIVGAPTPPPPADVPALEESGAGRQVATSMRERIEQHRQNPVCASCHMRMDPLGFALENFDGIGKWRTQDGHALINAAGALPDGTNFDGVAEFRQALLSQGGEFVRTFTEQLLTYALGRGVEYYDMPAVRTIIQEAAPDYRWSSLILGIAKSTPFQMRAVMEGQAAQAQ
jgi:mono/diheme cytochrome c family protein